MMSTLGRRLSRAPWLVCFRPSRDSSLALGRDPQTVEMDLGMALLSIPSLKAPIDFFFPAERYLWNARACRSGLCLG